MNDNLIFTVQVSHKQTNLYLICKYSLPTSVVRILSMSFHFWEMWSEHVWWKMLTKHSEICLHVTFCKPLNPSLPGQVISILLMAISSVPGAFQTRHLIWCHFMYQYIRCRYHAICLCSYLLYPFFLSQYNLYTILGIPLPPREVSTISHSLAILNITLLIYKHFTSVRFTLFSRGQEPLPVSGGAMWRDVAQGHDVASGLANFTPQSPTNTT